MLTVTACFTVSCAHHSGHVTPNQHVLILEAAATAAASKPKHSIGRKGSGSDPEACKRSEILLIRSGDRIFFSVFQAKFVFPRRARAEFPHERGIHQSRSMNPHESIWFQFLRN